MGLSIKIELVGWLSPTKSKMIEFSQFLYQQAAINAEDKNVVFLWSILVSWMKSELWLFDFFLSLFNAKHFSWIQIFATPIRGIDFEFSLTNAYGKPKQKISEGEN